MSLPLGVCVFAEAGPNAARTVSYPRYIHEILAHAGVFYEHVAHAMDALRGTDEAPLFPEVLLSAGIR